MKYPVMALLLGAAATLCFLSGCETLSQSPGENANTMGRTCTNNLHEATEDTESLLLLNNASYNSIKPIPNN